MGLFHNRRKWFKSQERARRTISIFLSVVLLCLSTLGSFSYAFAKESTAKLLSSVITFNSIKLYHVESGKKGEEVKKDEFIKKDENLFLWYEFEIGNDTVATIEPNVPYYLNVSSHLTLPNWGDKSEELKLTYEDEQNEKISVTFASLHSDGEKAWMSFTASTVDSSKTVVSEYEGVEDAHFYLECGRAKNPPAASEGEDSSNNRFLIKFENGEQLPFGYWELVPVYADAKLKKSGNRDGEMAKTITWSIDYTPMQNPEKGEGGIAANASFELRDTIDTETHHLLTDTLKIGDSPITFYTSRAVIPENAEAYAFLEEDGKILVIGGTKLGAGTAKQGETVDALKITYQTEIVDTLLLKTLKEVEDTGNETMLFAKGSGVDINNHVQLYANTGDWKALDTNASDTVSISKPEWIKKASDTKRTEAGSSTTWTITFYPNGFSFDTSNALTLHDKLPEYSTFVGTTVDVKIGSHTTPMKVIMDTATNSFTVPNIVAIGGESVVISYQTSVPEDVYENGSNLGANVAWFTFTYDSTAYETPEARADVGSGISGLGTSPLVKTNSGYEHKTRSITWAVTINPHKANFTSGTFVDDLKLSATGGSCKDVDNHGSGLYLPNGVDDVAIEILDLAGTKVENKDLVEVDYTDQEIKIQVGNIGKSSVTLTYTTKVCDPCLFANNHSNYVEFTNVITSTDLCINEKKRENVSAFSYVYFDVKILTKNPPTYDYATGDMIWTVDVNEYQLPLTNIILTDELQEGLRYVENSLKTEPEISTAKASTEGQTLSIDLGNISKHTKVTFRTKVDWTKMNFDGGKAEMEIANTIAMEGFADGVPFEDSHSVTRTFVNHGLVKTDKVKEVDELIEYEVLINPYGLTLPEDPTLVDTLDKKLQLDWDSLKLYKAVVSGTVGEGAQLPSYTKGELLQDLTVTDYDADKNQFTVELPIPEGGEMESYVLTYTADMITYEKADYTNRICFQGETALFGGERNNSASVSGGGGGGGGGGVAARKAAISITKVDADTKKNLEGITFVLYRWDSKKQQRGLEFAKANTDNNGTITFRGLTPNASYELVETGPEFGYKSEFNCETVSEQITHTEDNKWIVTAGAKGTNLALTLTNEVYKADIGFKIETGDGIPLSGQSVTLLPVDATGDPAGTEIIVKVLPDGTVTFSNIYPGVYHIKDPSGNNIAKLDIVFNGNRAAQGNGFSIEVYKWDEKTGKFEDESVTLEEIESFVGALPASVKTWTLEATKVSSDTKKALSGAVFGLYAEDSCKTLIKTLTSDASGKFQVSNLIEGQNYYLKEITAPSGYELSTTVYTVTSTQATLTIENTLKKSNESSKPDDTETPDDSKEDEVPDDSGDSGDDEGSSSGSGSGSSHKGESSSSSNSSVESVISTELADQNLRILGSDVPKTGDTLWWIGWVTLFSWLLLLGLTVYALRIGKRYEQK